MSGAVANCCERSVVVVDEYGDELSMDQIRNIWGPRNRCSTEYSH